MNNIDKLREVLSFYADQSHYEVDYTPDTGHWSVVTDDDGEKARIAIDLLDKMNVPSDSDIKEAAKHEDSDGYFGFIEGAEWFREQITGARDE